MNEEMYLEALEFAECLLAAEIPSDPVHLVNYQIDNRSIGNLKLKYKVWSEYNLLKLFHQADVQYTRHPVTTKELTTLEKEYQDAKLQTTILCIIMLEYLIQKKTADSQNNYDEDINSLGRFLQQMTYEMKQLAFKIISVMQANHCEGAISYNSDEVKSFASDRAVLACQELPAWQLTVNEDLNTIFKTFGFHEITFIYIKSIDDIECNCVTQEIPLISDASHIENGLQDFIQSHFGAHYSQQQMQFEAIQARQRLQAEQARLVEQAQLAEQAEQARLAEQAEQRRLSHDERVARSLSRRRGY